MLKTVYDSKSLARLRASAQSAQPARPAQPDASQTVVRLRTQKDISREARLLCEQGRLERLRLLSQQHRWDVNWQDSQGFSALMMAASHRHLEVVQYLLQHPRIDLNLADHQGRTALWFAVFDPVRSDLNPLQLRSRSMAHRASVSQEQVHVSQLSILDLLASDVRCDLTLPRLSSDDMGRQSILNGTGRHDHIKKIDTILAHYEVPDIKLELALSKMVYPIQNLNSIVESLDVKTLSPGQFARIPEEFFGIYDVVFAFCCCMVRLRSDGAGSSESIPALPFELYIQIVWELLLSQNTSREMRSRSSSPYVSTPSSVSSTRSGSAPTSPLAVASAAPSRMSSASSLPSPVDSAYASPSPIPF